MPDKFRFDPGWTFDMNRGHQSNFPGNPANFQGRVRAVLPRPEHGQDRRVAEGLAVQHLVGHNAAVNLT